MLTMQQINVTKATLYKNIRICQQPDYSDPADLQSCLELLKQVEAEELKTKEALDTAKSLRCNPQAAEFYAQLDSVISELKGGAAYEN
jgi:hypothetical protein